MSPTAQKKPARKGGDPNVAVLLTWFLPGAGHLYLGRTTFALIAFALVEGLYLVGLKLSDGMVFEFLTEELRGPLAPVLSPEAGNLGGLLWQMRTYGYGFDFPRPWPDWIHLGAALTALSGVLNACLMAQAHFEARRGTTRLELRSPGVAAALTWALPGLGHVVQGRKLRGALLFVAIVGLLVLGTALADGSNLSRERHFYYWGGQFLAGIPAVLLEALHAHAPVRERIAYGDAGLVMASIAGLLNVLAMLDAYAVAERSQPGEEPVDKDAALAVVPEEAT